MCSLIKNRRGKREPPSLLNYLGEYQGVSRVGAKPPPAVPLGSQRGFTPPQRLAGIDSHVPSLLGKGLPRLIGIFPVDQRVPGVAIVGNSKFPPSCGTSHQKPHGRMHIRGKSLPRLAYIIIILLADSGSAVMTISDKIRKKQYPLQNIKRSLKRLRIEPIMLNFWPESIAGQRAD